jgi:3-deoxy-D-arabino-heptulosonate 7-phosphate (DAHP) synthase class II
MMRVKTGKRWIASFPIRYILTTLPGKAPGGSAAQASVGAGGFNAPQSQAIQAQQADVEAARSDQVQQEEADAEEREADAAQQEARIARIEAAMAIFREFQLLSWSQKTASNSGT